MASTFAQIPSEVIESPAYMTLPGKAPQVLAYMAAKYRGDNNGDLSVTYAELRAFGLHNKSITLAFSSLKARGLILQTRNSRGHGSRFCSLYALGWLPINKPVIRKLQKCGYNGPVMAEHRYLKWSRGK